MPIHNIRTKEYECSRCNYRWVGRKNGIERKDLPRFCPKCKTWMWNIPPKNNMHEGWRQQEYQRYLIDSNEGEKPEAFLKRTRKNQTPYPYKYFGRD